MKKEHYIHQRFLIDNNKNANGISPVLIDDINLEEVPDYGIEYNLFDCNSFCRKIKI